MTPLNTPAHTTTDDIILVINSGSSSVKYQLLAMATNTVLLKGLFEGIGREQGQHSFTWQTEDGQQLTDSNKLANVDYAHCFSTIADIISETRCPLPTAIGHRIIHGGDVFDKATLIDESVIAQIEHLSVLAPLHNSINVQCIRTFIELYPTLPQIAVFDTAFHQAIPDYAYRYPVPDMWYTEHKIRKYGFHGTSHQYVAQQTADYLQQPLSSLNIISLHLGNGASIAAIEKGKSIDTSMGFTPLAGLMMGTRCGDIDPAIPLYIQQQTNSSASQVNDELNHHSGLLAIAGSQDMRDVINQRDNGDAASELAINMYCYRLKTHIGGYLAALGHVDAIIFTGGIGEHSALIRAQTCQNLQGLGIKIDSDLNDNIIGEISPIHTTQSPINVFVIKTDEERQIAIEVHTLLTCYTPSESIHSK
jgi:acetate kinase